MVQLTKVVFTPRLQNKSVRTAVIKMVLALLVATTATWLLEPYHYRDLAVYGLAGAGLAMAFHKLIRWASLYGDWLVTTIMRQRRP